jgi:negative elongation factor C/D
MTSISTILGDGRTNVADMDKIYGLYTSAAPPPVKYIRRPDFIDILVHDLFETSSSSMVTKEDARKWIWVAAYASAIVDNRPILAYADTDRTQAPLDPPRVDKNVLEVIAGHITAVRDVCRRSYFGPELVSAVDQLRAHVDSPLASLGIIRWVRANLVEGNNFATAFNTKSSTSYFALLREICHIHPFQRPKVFEVLTACFEVETDLDALMALSAKKVVVDQFAFLMEVGYVPPVLKYAVSWTSRHVDQSVTRHFITKVLDNSEPPYSVQFIEAMVSLLAPLTVEALKASETAKVVNPFLLHCSYSGYSLPKDTSKQLQQVLSATKSKG